MIFRIILLLAVGLGLAQPGYCPPRTHWDAMRKLISQKEVGLNSAQNKSFAKGFKSGTATLPTPERKTVYPYNSALAVLGTGLYLQMPFEDCGRLAANVFTAVLAGAPAEEAEDLAEYGLVIQSAKIIEVANALKAFKTSPVKPRIYNEFILHSVEYNWRLGLLPVLCRGLVYARERGLDDEKAVLAMMVDVDQGKRDADEIVLRMISTLRQLYPKSWRPLSSAERKLKYLRQEQEKQKRTSRHSVKTPPTPSPKLKKKIQRQKEIVARQRQASHKKQVSHRLQQEEKTIQKARAQSAKKRRSKSTPYAALKAAVTKWLGVPYKFGGENRQGIDCSAFTRAIYRDLDIELPRNSRRQARVGPNVERAKLQAGDLVFFDMKFRGRISHVGVYVGEGKFAHASCSKGVTRSNFSGNYYQKRFVKARRIL